MKKKITGVLLALWIGSIVFAIDIAVGGDIDYSYYWYTGKQSSGDVWDKVRTVQHLTGLNVFGDFEYATVTIGTNILAGGLRTEISNSAGDKTNSAEKYGSENIVLRLVGKYPFNVGSVKMYPMAGFQCMFNTSYTFDGTNLRKNMTAREKADLNAYFVLAGFGVDIFTNNNVFFRITPLFAFQVNKPSSYEDKKAAAEALGKTYTEQGYALNIGLGAGYKF